MKALQSIIRWFKAKDAEASEAIEQEHEVSFAKQDLEAMQKDLSTVTNGLAEVKATITGLKRDLNDKERQVKNLTEDAQALLEKGREDLATDLCAKIEMLEQEAEVYRGSIANHESHLKSLEDKRVQLKEAMSQAKSSLKMMQTMDTVARASEKVASVKVGNTTSALSRFQDRQKRIQSRLDKANAVNEMANKDSGSDKKAEIDKALGRGKGSSVLERLKKNKS